MAHPRSIMHLMCFCCQPVRIVESGGKWNQRVPCRSFTFQDPIREVRGLRERPELKPHFDGTLGASNHDSYDRYCAHREECDVLHKKLSGLRERITVVQRQMLQDLLVIDYPKYMDMKSIVNKIDVSIGTLRNWIRNESVGFKKSHNGRLWIHLEDALEMAPPRTE